MYSLDDLRRNDLARTAPGGEAVEDHEGVLCHEGLVELGLSLEVVYAFLAHCWRKVSDSCTLESVLEDCRSGLRECVCAQRSSDAASCGSGGGVAGCDDGDA